MARRPYADSAKKFDPTRRVIARRSFVAAGRHYSPGDEFKWQSLAVSRRRVRLMFEAGRLRHDEDAPKKETKAAEPTKTVATETGPVSIRVPDELDDVNDMVTLREIAMKEGAKLATSKVQQRNNIRSHRKSQSAE